MSFDFGDMYKHWLNIDAKHAEMKNEFDRLRIEPSAKVPAIGDRVVVASGLLGRGHSWKRCECRVVETGETSIKVQSIGDLTQWEEWISPVLITDVLEAN